MPTITDLIEAARGGDGAARDELFAETYRELRSLARSRLRGGPRDALLDTTSLVHESYLRLIACERLEVRDRVHFLNYAGSAMRSVIVDCVRKWRAARHGGESFRTTLSSQVGESLQANEDEILRVHEALEDLAKFDARMVQVVEMRYFAGMSETEIADALSISDRTVRREWEKARLWLAQALS